MKVECRITAQKSVRLQSLRKFETGIPTEYPIETPCIVGTFQYIILDELNCIMAVGGNSTRGTGSTPAVPEASRVLQFMHLVEKLKVRPS